jgi:hypothetical protein
MNPVLQQLQTEIAQSIADLTAEQTQFHPIRRPGKWTIQQIIQHLCLTYSSTSAVISTRLAKGHPTKTVPTFGQRCAQFYVTTLGRFPFGREAPAVVCPPDLPGTMELQVSGTSLASETEQLLEQMDKVLELADQSFGQIRLASHGVLGPLTSPQWRGFHLVHGRHHIKQIQAIRRDHKI